MGRNPAALGNLARAPEHRRMSAERRRVGHQDDREQTERAPRRQNHPLGASGGLESVDQSRAEHNGESRSNRFPEKAAGCGSTKSPARAPPATPANQPVQAGGAGTRPTISASAMPSFNAAGSRLHWDHLRGCGDDRACLFSRVFQASGDSVRTAWAPAASRATVPVRKRSRNPPRPRRLSRPQPNEFPAPGNRVPTRGAVVARFCARKPSLAATRSNPSGQGQQTGRQRSQPPD